MLESIKHRHSAFITLTYANEFVPGSLCTLESREIHGMTLHPRDAELWLKKVRISYQRTASQKIRFFLCGEYGEENDRPHYHAILFGFEAPDCLSCKWQLKRKDRYKYCDCTASKLWGMGNVYVGSVTPESMGYCCGYVTKKLAKEIRKDKGQYPEYSRMSLRPGIGADAMSDLANILNSKVGADSIITAGDLPGMLRHGKRTLPLGRYLKKKMALQLGYDEEKLSAARMKRFREEMELFYATSLEPDQATSHWARYHRKDALVMATEQKAAKQKARYEIYMNKKGILG